MAEFCAVMFAVLFSAVQECRRPEPVAVRGAPRRSRRSKYSDAVRQACLSYWHAAKRTAEVRAGVNTRTTYKAAFEYFRRALVEIGVKTVEAFKRIIHAVQSRECAKAEVPPADAVRLFLPVGKVAADRRGKALVGRLDDGLAVAVVFQERDGLRGRIYLRLVYFNIDHQNPLLSAVRV